MALENLRTLGRAHVELIDAFVEATDVAFFYYVGHGIYDHRERLCLAVGDTRTHPDYTTHGVVVRVGTGRVSRQPGRGQDRGA